jgi:hypothetical protein
MDSSSRASSWPFHTKICIESLPIHAWFAEGVRQVLGDICVFDYTEATTFRQENTTIFSFFATMKNPDLLPHSKEVTVFAERAGRCSSRDGPPPVDAPLATPPERRDITVLILLDHYYDWTLLPPSSGSSGVSGLPSSSGSIESRPFPVFRSFVWCPGVLDGQSGARLSSPRMFHPCHRMPLQGRRDEDPEDDD